MSRHPTWRVGRLAQRAAADSTVSDSDEFEFDAFVSTRPWRDVGGDGQIALYSDDAEASIALRAAGASTE